MKIIFDFDDTLFDRDNFMQEVARIFDLFFDDFLISYHHHFKEKDRFYNPYEHLKVWEDQKGGSFEQVKKKKKALDQFLTDTSEFLSCITSSNQEWKRNIFVL